MHVMKMFTKEGQLTQPLRHREIVDSCQEHLVGT